MVNNTDNHHHQLPPPSYWQSLPSPSYSLPLPYLLQLRNFRIEQMGNASNVRNHQFPLARIRKIMKSNPNVHMVTAEAPILLSKACEMLIVDLTMRTWLHTVESRRQKIQRSDISVAVTRSLNFSFLVDVVPRDESVAAAADPCFVDMLHPDGEQLPPGMVIGHPVVDCNGMYAPPPQRQELPAAPGDGEEAAAGEEGSSGGN